MNLDRQSMVLIGLSLFLSIVSGCMTAINICSKDWGDVCYWSSAGALFTIVALIFANAQYECQRIASVDTGSASDDSGGAVDPYCPPRSFWIPR